MFSTESVKAYWRWLFITSVVLITILSLMPASAIPDGVEIWDKAQHAGGFAALALIGACAFSNRITWLVAGLLVHGAIIEVLQMTLTSTRTGDVFDWFADVVGVLIGLVLYSVFLHARRRLS